MNPDVAAILSEISLLSWCLMALCGALFVCLTTVIEAFKQLEERYEAMWEDRNRLQAIINMHR